MHTLPLPQKGRTIKKIEVNEGSTYLDKKNVKNGKITSNEMLLKYFIFKGGGGFLGLEMGYF